MKRVTPLLLALVLAAGTVSCGDDGSVLGDGDTTSAPTSIATTAAPATTEAPPPPPPTTAATTVPPATTAAPTTSAAPPPPTSTTAAPPTTAATVYTVVEGSFFPEPLPGSDDAHGSGCVVPGGSLTLPDGIWFGFVEAFSPGMLTFDLACFWTGAAAEAKALEDGEEAFDFYIRNHNPTTRQVPLSGSARVWYVDTSGPLTMVEIPANQWPHPSSFLSCPADWCSVWVYVNGGEATFLVEQYLP